MEDLTSQCVLYVLIRASRQREVTQMSLTLKAREQHITLHMIEPIRLANVQHAHSNDCTVPLTA